MNRETYFSIIIVCLFASTLFVTHEYVKISNELKETKRALEIFDELAYEFWAKDEIEDLLNIDLYDVDMVNHFTFKAVLHNGTILTCQHMANEWTIN